MARALQDQAPTPPEHAMPPPAADPAPGQDGIRLIVVSNRLPVTVTRDASSGAWHAKMSSGGLVAALSGLKREMPFTWIGWPGADFAEADRQGVRDVCMSQHSCVPVFLPEAVAEGHYNGFSNSIMWPLLHYQHELQFDDAAWSDYVQANHLFADAVLEHVKDGDLVWVHDYHLFLAPEIIRAKCEAQGMRAVRIGFFLHTPFPSSEIFRALPVRKEILRGLLSADLVGFHTFDYARHFLSSCTRILGCSTMSNGVEFEGRFVTCGTFPIGIDPTQFTDGLHRSTVRERIAQLKRKYEGVKICVGVDRLDYIKNIGAKLHAFEVLLSKHPEWIGKVVLLQVAVPSRGDVEEYQQLRMNINELVGRINGQYGTADFTPIIFLHRSVPFDELVALYAVSDVCAVTSSRDGMNLVSFEYIASQVEGHGSLVLSEFAGAASSLNGSIICNPWDTDGLADALYQALTMDDATRASNHAKLYRYVTKYTAAHWGLSFISELRRVRGDESGAAGLAKLAVGSAVVGEMVFAPFAAAKHKVVLLDYDDTLLSTSHKLPEFARPSASVTTLLRQLAELPDTYVYILSGRARRYLESWFGDTGVGLSSEHGAFYLHPPAIRAKLEALKAEVATTSGAEGAGVSGHLPPALAEPTDDNGWVRLARHLDGSWKDAIRPLFDHYTERTPGAFVEDKEVICSFNFRNTDPEYGAWQANELQMNLERLVSHMAVCVTVLNKQVEIRPASVDKGAATRAILRDLQAIGCAPEDTFVLAFGDGKTDEPVFSVLADRGNATACVVGLKQTEARVYVDNVKDVQALLAAVVDEMVLPVQRGSEE